MSLMKEYFFNIKCDVCGCLCDDELWNTDIRRIKEIAVETGWIKLGGKDYCQDCWKYDEDDNIITSDGKRWNGETYEEIKNNYDYKNRR